MSAGALVGVRLPLPWDEFDLPNPLHTSSAALTTGDPAWAWTGSAPSIDIGEMASDDMPTGSPVEGWDLDHVVVLVSDLDATIGHLTEVGIAPRMRTVVNGRRMAWVRPGPLVHLIEGPVRSAALYGVALVTDEPLETVALRWRSLGRDVGDIGPAIQPGRRSLTVHNVEAGLVVMSPDRAVDQTAKKSWRSRT